MLDNLKVKIGDAWLDFSSIVRGTKSNEVAYQDAMQNSVLSKNPNFLDPKEKKIDFADEDIIGSKYEYIEKDDNGNWQTKE